MPCPPDRLSAPPGCSTQGVRSPAADFRRGAVLFVRRSGQTRRSCCPNQLVSPRAVLIYGALARLFYDVTGDRPTIQKDTQKAEHTHSVCSAEKDAQSPHRPPRSRANQRRKQGRAEPADASHQYRTKRKVCSRPYAIKARPLSGHALRDPAACAAVRRSFPQNQQSSCPTPFV